MADKPFTLRSFPKAIIHVDGDAFFASCEQSMNPALRGKPVVTGQERGIASAMSYEAKARGVTRGMPIWQIKKVCPEVIIVPSNYEAYSLYALRMYEIVRRYTPMVEEYSIDECFAEITGMRRSLHMSYEKIAESVKAELDRELGFTFSIGLAPTKVLAKVASKWDKPSGCVSIPGREAHTFLQDLSVGDVWGIGRQTTNFLNHYGIRTAYHFATKSTNWVAANLSKPYQEIHHELRAQSVLPVDPNPKPAQKSISKTKTFTPPSDNIAYVVAQLSKNIENACIKARRHCLYAKSVSFFFKTQDFNYHGGSLHLNRAINTPSLILDALRPYIQKTFRKKMLYRGSGVTLSDLQSKPDQPDLFSGHTQIERYEPIFNAVDAIAGRFGKHTVHLGASHLAHNQSFDDSRAAKPQRFAKLLKGENKRKHLGIPSMGSVN